MHLFGFIIRTDHDARSPERQIRYDLYAYREWRNYVTTVSKDHPWFPFPFGLYNVNLGQYYQTHTPVNSREAFFLISSGVLS